VAAAGAFRDKKRKHLPTPSDSCSCEPPPQPHQFPHSQPASFQSFASAMIFSTPFSRRYNPLTFICLRKSPPCKPCVFMRLCNKQGEGGRYSVSKANAWYFPLEAWNRQAQPCKRQADGPPAVVRRSPVKNPQYNAARRYARHPTGSPELAARERSSP